MKDHKHVFELSETVFTQKWKQNETTSSLERFVVSISKIRKVKMMKKKQSVVLQGGLINYLMLLFLCRFMGIK